MLIKDKQQDPGTESGPTQIAIVRHKQVKQRLQVSSSKLYLMVATGLFPPPFLIVPGGRSKGWLEADVDQWILEQKRRSEESLKC
jgi:predicted DNA-binding transcriptional regulator AlpA